MQFTFSNQPRGVARGYFTGGGFLPCQLKPCPEDEMLPGLGKDLENRGGGTADTLGTVMGNGRAPRYWLKA